MIRDFLLNCIKFKLAPVFDYIFKIAPFTDMLGNPLLEDNERTITDNIEPINFGLTGGIGVSYDFGSSELNLDIRGSGGFTHIQKDKDNGVNTTGALVVTA